MNYSFKMQSVLDYRKRLEDQKKNEMGKAILRLEKESQKLKDIEDSLHNQHIYINNEASNGISISDYKNIANSIDFYKSQIKVQKIVIEKIKKDIDFCRNELIEASKNKKGMERLKNKDFINYTYCQKKQEEKMNDEIVSFKRSIEK